VSDPARPSHEKKDTFWALDKGRGAEISSCLCCSFNSCPQMCISQGLRGVHIFIIPFLAFFLTSQNAMHMQGVTMRMFASTSLKTHKVL